MANNASLKEKANNLGDIIDKLSGMSHNSQQNLKKHAKDSLIIHSLEAILEKSMKNHDPSFIRTRTYKEGKKKISLKTTVKEVEKRKKEEEILKLFSNSSRNSTDLINPELMKDKEVIQVLKKNKRSFGLLEASGNSLINLEKPSNKELIPHSKNTKLSFGLLETHRKSLINHQCQLTNYHPNQKLIKKKNRKIFNSGVVNSEFMSIVNKKCQDKGYPDVRSQYLSPKISPITSPIDSRRSLVRTINKFEIGYTPKLESIKLKLKNRIY